MARAVGARRWGVVLLGALLLAPPVAAAAPSPRISEPSGREVLDRSDLLRIRKAALERSLERLGVHERALDVLRRAQRVRTGRWVLAEPAGDLDGDGTDDVFESDIRYRITVGNGGAPSPEDEVVTFVTARDGATGKKIWRKKYDSDAWPVAWRVGPKGRPGALVLGNVSSLLDPAGAVTLSFDAVTGKGRRAWSRSYTSTSTGSVVSWVAANQLVSFGRFDALPGKADELMLGLSTMIGTIATSSAATRTIVVDGRDGTEITHPVVDVGVGWVPLPGAVGDLDRDGFEDVVTTNNPGIAPGEEQEPPSFGPMVYARRGADGASIWHESVPMEDFAYAWDIGDVAGTKRPEVVLDTVIDDKWHVYLLDGGYGTPWWDRAADWVSSPGDVDGDGRDDVIATRWRILWQRGRMLFTQNALRGSGRRIWTSDTEWDHEDPPCPRVCSTWVGMSADDWSDLDPDGVNDMVMNLSVGQEVLLVDQTSRVLDGRTGRLAYETDAQVSATRIPIDGHGDDLTTLSVANNTMTFEAVDGRGRKLWGGPLVGPRRVLPRSVWHFAFGLRMPGDRCGEVLVDVFDGDDTFYAVFDGATGRILWSRWSGAPAEHPAYAANRDLNRAC